MLLRQFITSHTVLRLLAIYIVLILLLDVAGGDLWLAAKLYQWEGNRWSLMHHWLTEDILHLGARKLNYVLCAAVLITTVYYAVQHRQYPRLARCYVALSAALISSFALVAWGKAITNIACPWDLVSFGGSEPYLHLWQARPGYLHYHQCFPAGHASVGYAWVALYYFYRHTAAKWRFVALVAALFAGILLGIAQQLRGAHFLSHDVTTLFICILCAKLSFMVFADTGRQGSKRETH